MSYIKFLNSEEKINTNVIPIDKNIIEIQNYDKNLSGFTFHLDSGFLVGHYEDFKYLYRQIDETTYQYSNDGSEYIEPEPIIIPEPIPPTEEELIEIEKQKKIFDLSNQIAELKLQLSNDDYIIIKLYELSLVNETTNEYNIEEMHNNRNEIRNQINELEEELSNIEKL